MAKRTRKLVLLVPVGDKFSFSLKKIPLKGLHFSDVYWTSDIFCFFSVSSVFQWPVLSETFIKNVNFTSKNVCKKTSIFLKDFAL